MLAKTNARSHDPKKKKETVVEKEKLKSWPLRRTKTKTIARKSLPQGETLWQLATP